MNATGIKMHTRITERCVTANLIAPAWFWCLQLWLSLQRQQVSQMSTSFKKKKKTQKHLEGVSPTLNQIIYCRLEDEQEGTCHPNRWKSACGSPSFRTTSVIQNSLLPNFNRRSTSIFIGKWKCPLVQDGTFDWRAYRWPWVPFLAMTCLPTWFWCVRMLPRGFLIRYSKRDLPPTPTHPQAVSVTFETVNIKGISTYVSCKDFGSLTLDTLLHKLSHDWGINMQNPITYSLSDASPSRPDQPPLSSISPRLFCLAEIWWCDWNSSVPQSYNNFKIQFHSSPQSSAAMRLPQLASCSR